LRGCADGNVVVLYHLGVRIRVSKREIPTPVQLVVAFEFNALTALRTGQQEKIRVRRIRREHVVAREPVDRHRIHHPTRKQGAFQSSLPLIAHFRPYESSAAAIAAAGLLELATAVSDSAEAERYLAHAIVILETLLGPEFLANETPSWDGILKHGSYHERKKLGVDESVMWGEYFFLSALDKALGRTINE